MYSISRMFKTKFELKPQNYSDLFQNSATGE